MKILALDLGKYKTVGCDYERETGRHRFQTCCTTPAALQLIVRTAKPDRVVIEICSIAGWVCDLVRRMGIEMQVASTNDDAWRWRKVKTKNDRRDALKLAQLSAVNQLREVHVPTIEVRQWRALIAYRQQLVRRRGKVKNHIRDLLLPEGQILPRGARCWTQLGVARLQAMAKPLAAVALDELWRGQLDVELPQLRAVQAEIAVVEEKLDAIAAADPRVALLRSIPGVGPRLSEAVVALFDRPERFRQRAKSVPILGWCRNSWIPARRRGWAHHPSW